MIQIEILSCLFLLLGSHLNYIDSYWFTLLGISFGLRIICVLSELKDRAKYVETDEKNVYTEN